jgi:hypothetical protein
LTGVISKVTTATASADTALAPCHLTGGNQFVTVSSSGATNKLFLPALSASMVGTVIRGYVGSNGFHLRVHVADVSTGKINNVTTKVAATIPANTLFKVECISATEWVLTATTNLGVVITAIIPAAY